MVFSTSVVLRVCLHRRWKRDCLLARIAHCSETITSEKEPKKENRHDTSEDCDRNTRNELFHCLVSLATSEWMLADAAAGRRCWCRGSQVTVDALTRTNARNRAYLFLAFVETAPRVNWIVFFFFFSLNMSSMWNVRFCVMAIECEIANETYWNKMKDNTFSKI